MKNIILLGATGSIGTQTLDVIRNNPSKYQLLAFSSGRNIDLTKKIIEEFKPKLVSVISENDALLLRQQYTDCKFTFGENGLIEIATFSHNNSYETILVTAVVGSIGLIPTLKAIEMGRTIALANKETLVTAGHIVMEKAKQHNVDIIPVDSEHSAIFQCLKGENPSDLSKIIITASGGSFRDKTRDQLVDVTVKEALNHPNWSMGAKITIDSASMMNKGLEVIEAHWLFDVDYDQIETILHRESVIHSMVEFKDTSIIAHLGTPDMRIPIQYALSYPNRDVLINAKPLKLWEVGELHFQKMDFDRFRCLKMAYEAGRTGHSMPTVLNAANEAAVQLFLQGKIKFLDIEKLIYNQLEMHKIIHKPTIEEIMHIDKEVKSRIITTF